MTIITKGMGAIIKNLKTVGKKARKERLEYLKGQRNIYKLDKTGQKDKLIGSMNKFLKDKKRKASPAMIDRYHKIMTSDFEKKTGPYFNKKGKK
jgi:hypothetical protein